LRSLKYQVRVCSPLPTQTGQPRAPPPSFAQPAFLPGDASEENVNKSSLEIVGCLKPHQYRFLGLFNLYFFFARPEGM